MRPRRRRRQQGGRKASLHQAGTALVSLPSPSLFFRHHGETQRTVPKPAHQPRLTGIIQPNDGRQWRRRRRWRRWRRQSDHTAAVCAHKLAGVEHGRVWEPVFACPLVEQEAQAARQPLVRDVQRKVGRGSWIVDRGSWVAGRGGCWVAGGGWRVVGDGGCTKSWQPCSRPATYQHDPHHQHHNHHNYHNHHNHPWTTTTEPKAVNEDPAELHILCEECG